MVNILPQFDPLEGLGKGLSQGFQDSFGEFYKRGQLSNSLNRIMNQQQGQPYDPLQTYATLASTPYLDPQHIGPLADLMRQQNIRSRVRNQGQALPTQQGAQPPAMSTNALGQPTRQSFAMPGQVPAQMQQGAPSQQASPQQMQDAQVSFQDEAQRFEKQPTSSLRNQGVGPLLEQTPVYNPQRALARSVQLQDELGFDQVRADKQADAEEIQRIEEDAARKATSKAETTVTDDLKDRLSKEIGKTLNLPTTELSSSIPPKVYDNLENKFLGDISRGLNQDVALRNAKNEANNFYRARNDLIDASKFTDPKEWAKVFPSIRSIYKKYGALDEMQSDLVNYQRMTRDLAASLAYPVSEKLKSRLSKYNGKQATEQFARDLVKDLGNEDSLIAIRSYLDDIGFDSDPLWEKLRELGAKDPDLYYPRHSRELGQQRQIEGLADIFYNAMTGKKSEGIKKKWRDRGVIK